MLSSALDTVSVIAGFWLLWWALLAVRRMETNTSPAICFVMAIHFVLCGAPLILDVLIGPPTYGPYHPGLAVAAGDPATRLIYAFYVMICPVIWWLTGRSKTPTEDGARPWDVASAFRPLFWILALSPLLLLLLSPDKLTYLTYGLIEHRQNWDTLPVLNRLIVSQSAAVSLLAVAGLLLTARRRFVRILLMTAPLVVLACWLNGKRHIVGYALVMWVFVFWHRGYLKGRRFWIGGALGLLFLAVFSHIYQLTQRAGHIDFEDPRRVYTNIRIDYGRDDVIKMAIYAELHPEERQILEYRGQSLLFDVLFFVPRDIWPEKPWPYAVYFTSAMLNTWPPSFVGWGMTTSWLDEAIANFGWLGLLLGPLTLSLVCRMVDRSRDPFVRFLGILTAILLCLVHLPAFLPMALLWIILVVRERRAQRRSSEMPYDLRPMFSRSAISCLRQRGISSVERPRNL